ncbi:hypothetical protein ACFOPQ_08750 [Deinococcus antarcticus]|uniref:Uncharacterized protein n=1 Tax=Deinococcus antarcticus TaxID=1298767 RepID=A0ABV8A9H9_9DEIO
MPAFFNGRLVFSWERSGEAPRIRGMPGIGLPELLLILALLVGLVLIVRVVLNRTDQAQRVTELEREVAKLKSQQN